MIIRVMNWVTKMRYRDSALRKKGQRLSDDERLIRGLGPTEDQMQIQIIKECSFLKYNDVPLLLIIRHIPNGGLRSKTEAARLKGMGVLKGTPDIHIPVPRHSFASLYIELKTEEGELSKDQKVQIKILRKLGNKVVVCRNVADSMTEIKSYLGI